MLSIVWKVCSDPHAAQRSADHLSPEAKSKALEIVLEYAKAFLQAAILAAVIIVFIAQSHLVDGVSMENTLHDRERLMVDKLSYRFIEPKRGEIIVFRFPQDPRSRFVKRVIGIPGDTVEIRNGVVYLNDVPLDEPYIKEPPGTTCRRSPSGRTTYL